MTTLLTARGDTQRSAICGGSRNASTPPGTRLPAC